MDTHFWKATRTGTLNIKHETLRGDAVCGRGVAGGRGQEDRIWSAQPKRDFRAI